jgi:hypothetical protein
MLIRSIATLFLIGVLAFPLVVGCAFASGRIDTTGLLTDKQLGGLSQVRVQLLLLTIAGAAFYLSQVAIALSNGSPTLPDIPESWVKILGLSNGLYVGGKSVSVARVVFNALNGGSDE